MKRKSFLKTLTLYLTVALLMLSVSVPAFASVPSRPSNQYVLDSAGVLSDATEQHIISENEKLFKECGGEIVIAAVDFLGGEEIDDYVYSMFNMWGVGSKERNNGILLVLAVAEDNYYAQAGYGIEDHFDGSLMQELLDDYLEDDFAAGDYDAGVKKFFDATLAELKAYEYDDDYDDDYDADNYGQGGAYDNYDSDDYDIEVNFGALIRNIFLFIVRLVVIIIVVIIIIAIIRSASHGGGNGGSGGGFWTGMFLGSRMNRRRHWHNPPPPPPPGGFGGPMPGPGRRSTPPRPNRGGGGFGGFSGGSRPGGFSGGGRSGGRPSGGGRSGGFSRGGGSRGGGAGRR